MSGRLFPDPGLLLRIEQMSVAAKKRIRGTMQGKRRSRMLGSSMEFADYRMYTPGDDTRQLDWNVYGRTGKAFIKQFMDEQELQVHLYVDVSRSMDFGGTASHPDHSKFLYARRLAACIGYITLAGYDRVGVKLFGEDMIGQLPVMRGKGSASRLFAFLEQAEVELSGNMKGALMKPSALPRLPGSTWIFSDFLYESGIEETLSYFLAARQEVVVVQVLSPEEVRPDLIGDLRLIDSETGEAKEVAVSRRVLEEYRKTVDRYTRGLQRFCLERGMAYVLAVTDVPVDVTVRRAFRDAGLLF